ncbi:ester cyclase [Rapidithrix thailandica]|uniref:Ester cyclase n=1 Tax=Rapidithrix thailandica TaxID=413964 RepID=A0AAW9S3F8_9BACT
MENKHLETLRKAHQNFNQRDLDAVVQMLSPSVNFTDHGHHHEAHSREEFKSWMEIFIGMSSDVQLFDFSYIAGEGNWVTARFTAKGTNDGMFENVPPSQKRFEVDICEVWHFNKQGEAFEGHHYGDALGLLIQIGHLHEAAH